MSDDPREWCIRVEWCKLAGCWRAGIDVRFDAQFDATMYAYGLTPSHALRAFGELFEAVAG